MTHRHLALIILILSILNSSEIQAQDWAALDHFAQANKALSPADKDENRVVFMGNSITIGWLEHYPEFFENKPYINRGIGGQTTPQMLIRFRQDVVALNPKIVVLLAGTNDIAGNTGPSTLEMIMDNIKCMVEIAMSNNIKVVLASVLPAADFPWNPSCDPHLKIPRLNRMLKDYSVKQNLVYLDYFSAMKDDKNGMKKELAYDGVHPNIKGYQTMAPLTEVAIKKVLQP
ncbi:MAG: SGNH/GDSL hydrolase family protein [Flavobacteriaceae bacterium]